MTITWKTGTGLPPSEISIQELEADFWGTLERAHAQGKAITGDNHEQENDESAGRQDGQSEGQQAGRGEKGAGA